MATLKQIRQRIKTSKNIQQITRAMKLVAAARLTKAKNAVEAARPYSEKMREFMASVGGGESLPDHPLLDRRPVKKSALLYITADRGLAGSYNANLIKSGGEWLKDAEGDAVLVGVGKKGVNFYEKRGATVIHRHTVPSVGASLEDATAVTEYLIELFTSKEVDKIDILYSRFFSAIRQKPTVVPLLPIVPPKAEEGETSSNKEYVYEPEPEELLGKLLPKYVLTIVLQTMLEASASEHGARMTAMSSATDNAQEMIDDLTLTANRARQAAITTQILEIVGGAEALKG